MSILIDSVPLEDPGEIERTVRRRLRHDQRRLLSGALLFLLFAATIDRFFSAPGEAMPPAFLAALVVSIGLALLRPVYRWRAGMLVGAMLCWGMFSAVHHGSVRGEPTMAFIAAVVVAGTYLRQSVLLLTVVLSLGLLAGLTWVQVQGLLPPATRTPDARMWTMCSAILMVMGMALINARRVLEQAYQRRLGQIEERMRLEQERDRSLRRFRRLFEINPTALLIQSAPSGTVREVNPAFVRLMGHAVGSLQGLSCAELWADRLAWDRHSQRLFTSGRTGWETAAWLHADGGRRQVMVSSELMEDTEGTLVLTTLMESSGQCSAL